MIAIGTGVQSHCHKPHGHFQNCRQCQWTLRVNRNNIFCFFFFLISLEVSSMAGWLHLWQFQETEVSITKILPSKASWIKGKSKIVSLLFVLHTSKIYIFKNYWGITYGFIGVWGTQFNTKIRESPTNYINTHCVVNEILLSRHWGAAGNFWLKK